MTAFRFGPYTLRPVTKEDRELLTAWIAADPFHRDTTPPEFFLHRDVGTEPFVLEDGEGTLFFLKLTRAMRLDIQFAPDSPETRTRTRDGMIEGVEWLAEMLARATGCRELIFESKNPALIRASEKRLGFVRSPNELVRPISLKVVPPGKET